jgi:hypothetical protein
VKIILEAPNHLNYHDITCTCNDAFNIVQKENEAYTVFSLLTKLLLMGSLLTKLLLVGNMTHDHSKPPIKLVPSITLVDSKCYHNIFIKPSVFNPVDEISK